MPTQFIHTANSVYEHDAAQRRIRRLQGDAPPTARMSDGWRAYEVILIQEGDPMVIAWGVREGALQTTVTSPVLVVTSSTEARRVA